MSDVFHNYDLGMYGQEQERPLEEVISGHGFLVEAHSLITENTSGGKSPSSDSILGKANPPFSHQHQTLVSVMKL